MRSKTASAEANFEPGRAAAKVRRQKKKKREREKRELNISDSHLSVVKRSYLIRKTKNEKQKKKRK